MMSEHIVSSVFSHEIVSKLTENCPSCFCTLRFHFGRSVQTLLSSKLNEEAQNVVPCAGTLDHAISVVETEVIFINIFL